MEAKQKIENGRKVEIEALKILTEFLSNNSWQIVIVSFLLICKKPITNLIERLTNINWKSGDSAIGVEAVHPNRLDTTSTSIDSIIEPQKKLIENPDLGDNADESQQSWLLKMWTALDSGNLQDAETAFKEYAINEKDPEKINESKALYLYFLYLNGNDNSAISQLENLVKLANKEESRFYIITWLAKCYRATSQLKAEKELWRKAIEEFQIEGIIVQSNIKLSEVLVVDGKISEAKSLIISSLHTVSSRHNKSLLFLALSDIEKELENKVMSIFCKDKSLEYDPDNRDELFNSAYQASEEKINELTLSNYVTLLRIDPKNSTALNNLGVCAQNLNLKIKAIENYKAASNLNQTLAMANQSTLLLEAGFADEAEEIAKKASQLKNPHENVYSLLSRIATFRKEQNAKWNDIVSHAKSRQQFIRNYTNGFYIKSNFSFEGEWTTETQISLHIVVNDNRMESSWKETINAPLNNLYLVKISGEITNSSFKGKYKKTKDDGEQQTLLGLSLIDNFECFGYLSDDGNSINISEIDPKKNITISLQRKVIL